MANQTGVSVSFADMAEGSSGQSKYIKGSATLIDHKLPIADLLRFINLSGQQQATVPRPNPDAAGGVFYRNTDGQYQWTVNSFENFTEDTAELTYAFKLDSTTMEDPSFDLFPPGPSNMDTLAEQWSAELLDSLFNGDPTVVYQTGPSPQSDPLMRVPGLRFRLQNGLNGIDTGYYVNSTTYGGGAAIDLTNIGSATGQNMTDMFNDMIAELQPDFIAMSYRMGLKAMRSLRMASGLLTITRDAYGRLLGDWGGVRVVFPGLRSSARIKRVPADTSNEVLCYEDASGNRTPTAGAGSQFESVWFVRTNQRDGFTGLTVSGMHQRGPEKLPLPDEGLGYAMRMGFGYATLGVRCIGAVRNIKTG